MPTPVSEYADREDLGSGVYRTRCFARRQYVQDSSDGQFKRYVDNSNSDIDLPGGKFLVNADGNIQYGGTRQIITVQRRNAGNWQLVNTDLVDVIQRSKTIDEKQVRVRRGPLQIDFTTLLGRKKFLYRMTNLAAQTQEMRMQLRIRFQSTPTIHTQVFKSIDDNGVPTFSTPRTHSAKAGNVIYDWLDIEQHIDSYAVEENDLVLNLKPVTLAPGQSVAYDPTTDADTDYIVTVGDSSTSYNKDSTNYFPVIGDDGGHDQRVAIKWDITALDASHTVSQVDLNFDLYAVSYANHLCSIGPYGSNGQDDPETDTGATLWGRLDVEAGTPYSSNDSNFSSTGTKSITLGSSANSHVEAARDAGTIYSIALQQYLEPGTAWSQTNVYGTAYDSAYTADLSPHISITHAAGGGGLSIPIASYHYRHHLR